MEGERKGAPSPFLIMCVCVCARAPPPPLSHVCVWFISNVKGHLTME